MKKLNNIMVGTPYLNRHKEEQVKKVIKNLQIELFDKSKPSPPEYSKTVDKYFWELS